MHSHSLFLKIRFFLLIRRRELSNSISLQKCFHQIKIPFRLNDKAHMTARNCADLRIQFPEQICEPFLIFLFENVISGRRISILPRRYSKSFAWKGG